MPNETLDGLDLMKLEMMLETANLSYTIKENANREEEKHIKLFLEICYLTI